MRIVILTPFLLSFNNNIFLECSQKKKLLQQLVFFLQLPNQGLKMDNIFTSFCDVEKLMLNKNVQPQKSTTLFPRPDAH